MKHPSASLVSPKLDLDQSASLSDLDNGGICPLNNFGLNGFRLFDRQTDASLNNLLSIL